MVTTLSEVWLLPPLGIARLGRSTTPCPNFQWGPNDIRPRGTGKTTITPAETLTLSEDGTVASEKAETVGFRDETGIRPVCTYFELHGRWNDDGAAGSGAVTSSLLDRAGLDRNEIIWSVEVVNAKAFHMTGSPGDKIVARIELLGNQTQPTPLLGSSPQDAQPLATAELPVPLGEIQLARSSDDYPEMRLRFTPPGGLVYGPSDLATRSDEYPIPDEHRILNPAASWVGFRLPDDDPRTNPGGLFATDANDRSLGLIDDVSDGIISCTLPGLPTARARIVVGPPRYAPDRRPFVSLADGLADRVKRGEVSEPAYVEDLESTSLEIRDLLERVWETMGLSNVDFQNERARRENRTVASSMGLPPEAAADKAFKSTTALSDRPLPLTEQGRLQHERLLSLEVFEDMLREQPDLIDRWIRPPGTADRYYDRRMPALYRGSDRYPMHVTRRQWDLLRAWVQRLRLDVEEGS